MYCPLFLTSTDVFKGSELKLAPEWGAPLIEGLVGEAVWETDQRSPGKNPNQLLQTLYEIPPSSVFMVETSRTDHSVPDKLRFNPEHLLLCKPPQLLHHMAHRLLPAHLQPVREHHRQCNDNVQKKGHPKTELRALDR